MYKAKKSLNIANTFSFNKYQSQILSLIGFMILSFASISSHALAPNPGAVCPANANFAQGSLTSSDYTNLVNSNNYVNIAGNSSGAIPLQIKMTRVESSSNTVLSSFQAFSAAGKTAINMKRNFPTVSDYTDINFEFRNSNTQQPLFLTNVAISAFDIDYSNNNNNRFYDYVKFTGVNADGKEILSVQQNIPSSFIANYQQEGLFTGGSNGRAFNCPARNLGTECQGSIQFPEPVKSVKIRYTNTGTIIQPPTTPTTQEVDIVIDNYCYVPQYIFSGTVFDDNGGIDSTRADKENADITTPTSAYSNNSNYFNGIFNTPLETGIAGSSVKLVSCTDTSTIYANQSVVANGTTIGRYQFSLPISTFGSNTNLCLIESRGGDTYPIRTSSENKTVGFATTTYNYPNNNFGRVIDANAAVVLKKYQYVNSCPATLNYSAVPVTADPRTGFSTSTINGSLIPGQCIAYKIIATNRANIPVDNFVMRDVLQSKGVKNATTTSVLVAPVDAASNYAGNSVAIGMNGTVISNSQSIPARKNRDFYFNTKYGLTQ